MVTSKQLCYYRVNRRNYTMMYMPIWILYWFPFILPINYVIKFVVIDIVLWICKKALNINGVRCMIEATKIFCFTVVSELVGVALFYIIETNFATDFYYGNYFAFCFFVFLCVIILNFILNYRFALKKSNLLTKQKIILITSIIVATAPYLFLLPI